MTALDGIRWYVGKVDLNGKVGYADRIGGQHDIDYVRNYIQSHTAAPAGTRYFVIDLDHPTDIFFQWTVVDKKSLVPA